MNICVFWQSSETKISGALQSLNTSTLHFITTTSTVGVFEILFTRYKGRKNLGKANM